MRYIFLFIIAVFVFSCRETYVPNFGGKQAGEALVVEGFINASGISEYRLSYSVPSLTQGTAPNYENSAKLQIESESEIISQSSESLRDGNYKITHLPLDIAKKYRLRIFIGSNEYLSEFVPVLPSPSFSADWVRDDSGVGIFVNSSNNDSEYIKFDYEETWKFRTPWVSSLISDNGRMRTRNSNEFIHECFRTENSGTINLYTKENQGSTDGLSYRLIHIPNLSEKLGLEYSVLVKLYTVTAEGFNYWSTIKKNSENVGDIFGTLPVEVSGNIKNVKNPSEIVIGYVEAGSKLSSRIFINSTEFGTNNWTVENPAYSECQLLWTPLAEGPFFFANNPKFIPLYQDEQRIVVQPEPLVEIDIPVYRYTNTFCADCRERGTLEKPSFWP